MLLESADPTSQRRIQLLHDLQHRGRLDAYQARWVNEELSRVRAGATGERDAAHDIDSHFKGSSYHVVIHDLRLFVEGDVAQIDHLIIARAGISYLLETKNFSGNLLINDQGEYTVDYGRDRYGIPSPLEQSRRHERVLARLLERLGIRGRLGAAPSFEHAVLVHPQATITRPNPKRLDTSHVIKADQVATWHQALGDAKSALSVLGRATQMRSLETIKEWGEMLVRQHRPADPMALPEFMASVVTRLADAAQAGSAAGAAASKPPAAPARTAARPSPAEPTAKPTAAPKTSLPSGEAPTASAASGAGPAPLAAPRTLVCAACGQKISYAEGKFCWNNEKRFGGLQYCRVHQRER